MDPKMMYNSGTDQKAKAPAAVTAEAFFGQCFLLTNVVKGF